MDETGEDPPPGEDLALHLTIGGRLRAYFLTGILVTAPVSITLYIGWMFIDMVDRQVTPMIPAPFNPRQWGIPGVGLLIAVVGLTLIGALADLDRRLCHRADHQPDRSPCGGRPDQRICADYAQPHLGFPAVPAEERGQNSRHEYRGWTETGHFRRHRRPIAASCPGGGGRRNPDHLRL